MTKLGCLVSVLVSMASLLALGCKEEETVDSDAIRTDGMYAEMRVVANGGGDTTVTVDLRVGGNNGTIVELAPPDKLVCTAGDSSKTLKASGDEYKATLGTDDGGTEFVIDLDRGEEDENASCHVALPDPFKIEGATSDLDVSRANDSLTVEWEPSSEENSADIHMSWTLNGDCLFETEGEMKDSGKLVLEGEDFNSTPGADNDQESCTATLCIERMRWGHFDKAFGEGGKISAIQKRCAKFTSTY